jgi:hypothetical protein
MQKSRLISFGGYQPAGLELQVELEELGHTLAVPSAADTPYAWWAYQA